MMVSDEKYQEHRVFDELENYIAFYSAFSSSVMGFATKGTTSIVNIDTYVYSSIQGTLDSIKVILKNGRINDSYCLLRKYYDSAIINIYSNLYIEDNCSLEIYVVEKINNWLHGKDQLPEYRVMSKYIRDSDKLKTINSLLHADDRYKSVRSRCNDHTHYNYFQHLMLNDNEIYLKNRISSLNDLSTDIRDIFIMHLSYMFTLHDHYMMSSDYVDHLDCGETPPENSQYWVAPFIRNMFENVIKSNRPDLASVIEESTAMHLGSQYA